MRIGKKRRSSAAYDSSSEASTASTSPYQKRLPAPQAISLQVYGDGNYQTDMNSSFSTQTSMSINIPQQEYGTFAHLILRRIVRFLANFYRKNLAKIGNFKHHFWVYKMFLRVAY